MKRKNSPVKSPETPQPVTQGNVFATFIKEAQILGNEIEARRAFDREVGVFLAERDLVPEFEKWREARKPKE